MLRIGFGDLSWSDNMGCLRFKVKWKMFYFQTWWVPNDSMDVKNKEILTPRYFSKDHQITQFHGSFGIRISSQNYLVETSIFAKTTLWQTNIAGWKMDPEWRFPPPAMLVYQRVVPVQRTDHIFQSPCSRPCWTRRFLSSSAPKKNSQRK